MVGNRDFMDGKSVCSSVVDVTLLTLIPTIDELNWQAIEILLMHGDSLCIDDVRVISVTAVGLAMPLIAALLSYALSARYRQGISDKIKQKSREQKQHKTAMIMDVNQDEVGRVMQQYQVQYIATWPYPPPSYPST